MQAFNQIAFENERFEFRLGQNKVDIFGVVHHGIHFGTVLAFFPHVGTHAAA